MTAAWSRESQVPAEKWPPEGVTTHARLPLEAFDEFNGA